MLKKYRIIKIGFAKNIKEALLNEDKAEVVVTELVDELTTPEEERVIGFKNK